MDMYSFKAVEKEQEKKLDVGNEDVDMDMYSFKYVKKEQQKKLDVGGMRTLTWICIVSKL